MNHTTKERFDEKFNVSDTTEYWKGFAKEIKNFIHQEIQQEKREERERILQLYKHCTDSGFSPEIIYDLIKEETHNDELLAEDYGVSPLK